MLLRRFLGKGVGWRALVISNEPNRPFMNPLLLLLGLGTGRAGEVEVEHGFGHPQRLCGTHHPKAAPSQRQAGDGPQAHADLRRALRHR